MNYNLLNLLVAIFSILITIFLAYYNNRQKSIYFFRIKHLNLYDDLSKSFERLKIKFDEKEITHNLIFISGVIIYKGTQDLIKEKILKPITFFLNENGNWKEFKIKHKSVDLEAESIIQQNKAILDIQLIKNNEFLYIEGLYESEKFDLDIKYRIENISSIKHEKVQNIYEAKQAISLYFLLASFIFVMFYLITPVKLNTNDLHQLYYINNKEVSYAEVIKSNDNYAFYKALDEDITETADSITKNMTLLGRITFNENHHFKFDSKVSYSFDLDKFTKVVLPIFSTCIFLFVLYLFSSNLFYYRSRKELIDIITKIEKK